MSEQLRQSFLSDFAQAPDKVVTVGAGANVATTEPPERDYAPPRFLFVGKQWERKGGPTVLRGVRAAPRRGAGHELVIAGPPSLSVTTRRRDAGRVSLEGGDGQGRWLDVRRATAFVMPSLYEPLGVAVLEAMAAGLPCIGSTGGALPELIEEGVTGFLVPPGDEEALLARMRELAGRPGPVPDARRGGRRPLPGAVHVGRGGGPDARGDQQSPRASHGSMTRSRERQSIPVPTSKT